MESIVSDAKRNLYLLPIRDKGLEIPRTLYKKDWPLLMFLL